MSDCSLETNHSSLNPEPAVICVWNEKHNSNVVHSFPDVWDPLQVMLNGLALIGQTIFSLSFHCNFSNRAINCLLVHRQNMHADMFQFKVTDVGEEKQTLKYSWVQFNWGEKGKCECMSVSFLIHLVFPSSQSLKWVGRQMLTLAPVR